MRCTVCGYMGDGEYLVGENRTLCETCRAAPRSWWRRLVDLVLPARVIHVERCASGDTTVMMDPVDVPPAPVIDDETPTPPTLRVPGARVPPTVTIVLKGDTFNPKDLQSLVDEIHSRTRKL